MNKEFEKVIHSFNNRHKDREVVGILKVQEGIYILEAPMPSDKFAASIFVYNPSLGKEKIIVPTEDIRAFREIKRKLMPVKEM